MLTSHRNCKYAFAQMLTIDIFIGLHGLGSLIRIHYIKREDYEQFDGINFS